MHISDARMWVKAQVQNNQVTDAYRPWGDDDLQRSCVFDLELETHIKCGNRTQNR